VLPREASRDHHCGRIPKLLPRKESFEAPFHLRPLSLNFWLLGESPISYKWWKTMAVRHILYGLRLAANLPIPSLSASTDVSDPDVQIHLKEKSGLQFSIFPLPSHFFYVSSNRSRSGEPAARVGMLSPDHYGFFYRDGARFAVRRDGREIWADGPENYSLDDLATYLVGPVMGFVLRLLGTLPLHGCAVAVEDRAIALVGPQGVGKSTTAAAFAKLGRAILSEDVVAVAESGDCLMVQPGYPRVNLWPESAETIFGGDHNLPPVTPTWGKHFLALDDSEHRFQNKPLELGAIFMLSERIPGLLKPKFDRIPPASAVTKLVANTYVNYLLDSAMRQREFLQLGRLVQRIPVYVVSFSDDPSRVYELCESIVEGTRRNAACPAVS